MRGVSFPKREPLFLLLLFLVSLLVFWQFGVEWQHITPDKSMQTYIAQEIIRGQAPYASVIFPKTPLTPILSAFSIFIGNRLGLLNIISVRILFLILGSLGVVFTFLVAKIVSPEFWPRLAAALTLLGFGLWGIHTASGAEPKILVTLLGLITLWALAEKRWLWSGLASSLAFLTWQPAGVYQVLSLALPFFTQPSNRRRTLLSAFLGLALPLALVGIYLLAKGALLPGLRQTILSQFAYLAEGGGGWGPARGVERFLEIFGDFLVRGPRGWGGEFWLVILGGIGWLGFTLQAIIARLGSRGSLDRESNRWPLIVSGYFWLLFSLRDIDGLVDLVPLLPYLAVGVAWLLGQGMSFAQRLPLSQEDANRLLPILPIAANLLILVYGLQDIPLNKALYPVTLQDQMQRADLLDSYLGPEGKVQAVGDLTLLVLSERENLTPLLHLGPKHYNLLLHEPGGLEAILNRLVVEQPEVMILQRVWDYAWAQPFFALAVDKIPNSYRANFADEIQVLGYDLFPQTAYLGGEVELTLYLSATAQTQDDYHLMIKLLAPNGGIYGPDIIEKDFPGEGLTPFWEIGAVIKKTIDVPVPTNLPVPAGAQLHLSFFPAGGNEPLPVLSIEGEVLGSSITLPPFRVVDISTPMARVPRCINYQVGDYFRLIGYQYLPVIGRGGLEVTLYWQSLAATTRDYQIFVHLIDSQGKIIAQGDSPPGNGFYPTSLWVPGETIIDNHSVSVPQNANLDEYGLRVGMYRLDTLERLPVFGENGERVENDEITLHDACLG